MRILFTKSSWEVADWPLTRFLERASGDGFDGTEVFIPGCAESPAEIRRLHAAAGLELVAQITTVGNTPEAHLRSLEDRFHAACECAPLLVNCHGGSDFFSYEDNSRILARGCELAADCGVPLYQETHRGRALFNLPDCIHFLEHLPALRLTLDLSHWYTVHESDLAGREALLARVVAATGHLHARVGFGEGPQVSDPRNPEHAGWVENHLHWWRAVVSERRRQGQSLLTITPEFGPPPYMPLRGRDPLPVADPWEVNVWMRDFLRTQFQDPISIPTTS